MANMIKDKVAEDLKRGKIPRGAMRFVDNLCDASIFSAEGDEDNKLNMTIYSGGVIKNHWYWDDLAIDLSGLSMNSKTLPILEDHDTSKKIAFSKEVLIDNENGVRVNSDKTVFLDTEESREFQKNSKTGFPYQASISVSPSQIQRLAEKEETEVNGFTMKGPGTVFRKARMNEGSVCVFGWDNKTQSSAFSKEEVDVDIDVIGASTEGAETSEEETKLELKDNNKGTTEEIPMTREELAKDNPELLASIEKSVTDSVTAALEAKHSGEKTELVAQVKTGDEKTLKLEKRELLRTEDENKLKAKVIVSEHLSKSDVPLHLYVKVHNMFNVNDFTEEDDDGFKILNESKFTEAVVKEIPDWEETPDEDGDVAGAGFSKKTPETKANLSEEDEKETTDLANDMLSMAGQTNE